MADLETKKIYTIEVQGIEQVNDLKKSIDDLNNTMKGAADSMSSATESTKAFTDTLKNTESSVKSVKDLKAEISGLRDKLVTLEAGSDEYKAAVQNLIQDEMKLKEVMQAGKAEVNAAAGSYNALQREMSALRQVWKETTDETTRNEIGKKIAELNSQLKEMDASIGNFQRNVGNYPNSMGGMVNSFANLKQELRATKIAMEELDPASKEYAEAMARAAEITHELSEQQEMIRYSSPDLGDQLNNIRGVVANLAAGYSAVNAAMGLFGAKNEELKEALLKVQQAMALVQGLQGLDGLWKRTTGLSNAMKVWLKTEKDATVQTKAMATATKADATAKKTDTVATEGATVAQKGLNAAMKANPIGMIIVAITALIGVFTLFKDKIKDAIAGNEELSQKFDKIKTVLSGFGAVLKKFVINPIKLALVPLKTFGKVLYDVFTLNWSEIGKDIKDGADEVVDIVKDTVNVSQTYREAAEKKQAEIEKTYRKQRAEARKKELEDIIKDNEAKYGSDWKYTEKGKKLYEEYFKSLTEMYDKDSDEYKEALRDKTEYERDYNAKIAKQREEENKKALDDFKSAFSDIIPQWTKITMDIESLEKKWKDGAKLFRDELINIYGYAAETADGVVNAMADALTKKEWNTVAKKLSSDYEKMFYQIDRTVEQQVAELNAKFEQAQLFKGIIIPYDQIEHLSEVFKIQGDAIQNEMEVVSDSIWKFYTNLTSLDSKYLSKSFEEIGEEFSEFQVMLDKQNELIAKSSELQITYIQKVSDAYKQQMEDRADLAEKNFEHTKKVEEMVADYAEARQEHLSDIWGSYRDAFVNNSIQQYSRAKEGIIAYYDEMKDYYKEMSDLYTEYANNEALTLEEREKAKQEAAQYTTMIEEAEAQKQIDLLKNVNDYVKKWKSQITSAMSSIGTAFGNVTDYYYNMSNMHKEEIKKQLEAGEISEEEAKKREETAKEEFEKAKKFQIAETIINTLSSAMGAYQSLASIPYVGPVLGAAAAAAALMLGYSQVEQIKATQYESATGGSSLSSGGSTNFQLPNVQSLEPSYYENTTKENNTDILNNGGETEPVRCYVVESDITASQELANKRNDETTF